MVFPFYGKLTLKESGKSANGSMNVNKQSKYNTMQSDTRVKLRFGLGKALSLNMMEHIPHIKDI